MHQVPIKENTHSSNHCRVSPIRLPAYCGRCADLKVKDISLPRPKVSLNWEEPTAEDIGRFGTLTASLELVPESFVLTASQFGIAGKIARVPLSKPDEDLLLSGEGGSLNMKVSLAFEGGEAFMTKDQAKKNHTLLPPHVKEGGPGKLPRHVKEGGPGIYFTVDRCELSVRPSKTV